MNGDDLSVYRIYMYILYYLYLNIIIFLYARQMFSTLTLEFFFTVIWRKSYGEPRVGVFNLRHKEQFN